jgi:rRNA biogenesis protein RRP5
MEKTIRAKEAEMRSSDGAAPKSVNDFERLLVADYDQSYMWIQYMAFMLENLDAEAARRVAERAVNKISMTAEDDKLNLWIAYMNLESKFGTEDIYKKLCKKYHESLEIWSSYIEFLFDMRGKDGDFTEPKTIL